jgi:predicted flap endonuclease-1-like 5' DNA nuclease
MLHCSIANPLGKPFMPATNTLPRFPAFNAYVDPFRTTETALSLWSEYWRASTSAAFWWTEKWMQAPVSFLAWAQPASRQAMELRPAAPVIDLAQAAAARIAAETADIASVAVGIAETVAEVPVSVAEDVESVATHAAEALALTPDDLTRMVGIGPKLAAALAERGVTRFEQIARWGEKDLAEIDKALDLKGRAVRDAWVSQAKRFSSGG